MKSVAENDTAIEMLMQTPMLYKHQSIGICD